MKKFPFNVGDRVEVKRELLHETGFITFIDTAYFTLCVREWEDKGKKNGVGQVNLLIYRGDWEHVRRI
tara:strand:- start:114 stop:317 length:204 start_codon:yes stop_codon:yes gene_type:complete